jgi:ABC-type amino acid transport substrate-binding protein
MSISENELSRRDFLKIQGVAAAGVAAMGLAGCSSSEPTADAEEADSDAVETDGQIRFGAEAAYAPYDWKQAEENEYTLPIDNLEGQYADGVDVQLMKQIAAAMGKEPVYINMAFGGLIAALQNNQIDMICAGMSATEERKESVDFSLPYQHSGVGIMVAKDSEYADATCLEDFSGASILGQKSSLPDSVVEQIPDVIHLDPVDNIPESINRLIQGTVDGVVVDQNNKGLYEKNYPDFTVIVFEDGKGFDTPGVDPCVAVVKGDPEGYLDTVNSVIEQMTDEDMVAVWEECTERAPE